MSKFIAYPFKLRTTCFNIKKNSAFTHIMYLYVSYFCQSNVNPLVFVMDTENVFCKVGRYFKVLFRLISFFKRLYANVTLVACYVALGLDIC
jgi:hypothetical protein